MYHGNLPKKCKVILISTFVINIPMFNGLYIKNSYKIYWWPNLCLPAWCVRNGHHRDNCQFCVEKNLGNIRIFREYLTSLAIFFNSRPQFLSIIDYSGIDFGFQIFTQKNSWRINSHGLASEDHFRAASDAFPKYNDLEHQCVQTARQDVY
jgi:hypothetical protein